MPVFKTPKSQHSDFQDPKRKPTGEVEIDWSNPFSKGLKFLNLGNATGYDFVRDEVLSATGTKSSLSTQISNAEKCIVADGVADAGFMLNTIDADANTPWEVTFKVRRSGTSNHGMILGDQEGGCYFWVRSPSLQFADNTPTYYSFTTANGYTPTAIATYTITSDGLGTTSSNLRFYVDGVLKDTATSRTTVLDLRGFIDGYNVASFAFEGEVWYAKITTGVNYTENMVARQFADFYQILKPKIPQFYFTEGEAAGISIAGQTANYNYAGVSGSVDLTGSVVVTGVTGNYNYTGIIGAIDLTGEVIISGATGNYNYTGITGVIELGTEIIVVGQTANYNYTGIAGSVDLTGLISVIGQTANYNYAGIVADITLQGSIEITGETGEYNYNAIIGTVTLQGPISVNPKNVVRIKRKLNTLQIKRNINTIIVR